MYTYIVIQTGGVTVLTADHCIDEKSKRDLGEL